MDLPPVPSSQPKSSDVLKTSIAHMATVSSVHLDLPLQQDEDVIKRQAQRPPSVASHHETTGEPATRSVNKNSKVRGKPAVSLLKPPLKAGSGVSGSRGGDKRTAANGLLDVQPQAPPSPGGTFSVNQMSDVDCKYDTMELLREADVQNPNLENLEGVLDGNTLTLLKQTPAHPLASDVQVSVQLSKETLYYKVSLFQLSSFLFFFW